MYEGDIVATGIVKSVIKWSKSTASFYGRDEENDVQTVHLGHVELCEIIGTVYDQTEVEGAEK